LKNSLEDGPGSYIEHKVCYVVPLGYCCHWTLSIVCGALFICIIPADGSSLPSRLQSLH